MTPAQIRRVSALNVIHNGRVVIMQSAGKLEVCTKTFAGYITRTGRLVQIR